MPRRQGNGESAIQESIRAYLEARGWLVIRFETGLFVGWYQLEQLKRSILGVINWTNRNAIAGAVLKAFGRVIPTQIGTSTIGRKGFPDLIALRGSRAADADYAPPECLLIEVKAAGKKPSADQDKALDTLRRVFHLRAIYADGLEDGKQPFADYYRRKIGE